MTLFGDCFGSAPDRPADEIYLRQERARAQAELARQIAEALARRHLGHAQYLIEEGRDRFGHNSMLAAVERLARQEMDAAPARGVDQRPGDDNSESDHGRDHEPPRYEPRYYRSEEDRRRRNLAQFQDVRELVAAWRSGHIEWDPDRWGPPPDDVSCLIPWDVLQEARQ